MDTTKGRTYFLLLVLLGAAVLTFMVFRPFLTTIALAAVFAVVLHPVYRWLGRKLGKHRSIAALITIVFGLLVVLIPLSLVGTLVVNESRNAYASFTSGASVTSAQVIATNIGQRLEPFFPGSIEYANSVSLEFNSYVQRGLQWLVQRSGAAFTSILAIFLRLFIFVMALYYFLKEGSVLEQNLIKKSPLRDEEGAAIFKQLSRTINSVVKGSLAIACIQGTLAGIGFTLFGVPNAVLWGVCTAIAALIPGMGTSLVLIPAVLYLFITGNTGGGIGMLLWGTLLVGLIDNFLSPKLMGRGAQLHPLIILLSVLGGVLLFGPAGIFLGPLTVSFLFALYSVYAAPIATAE